MKRMIKPAVVSVVGVLALGVIGVAIAWACSPNASISLSASAADEGGGTVTVTGTNYNAGRAPSAPVEIRWNTVDGPQLRVVTDGEITSAGDFAVAVQIPAAQPDTHYVVAVTTAADGTRVARSAPYTIGAAASRPATAQRGANSQEARSGESAPASARERRGAAGRTSAGAGERPAARSDSRISGGEAGRRLVAAAPRAQAQAPAAPAAPAVAAPATPGASTRARARERRPASAAPAKSAPATPRPSERSASADLWSGFATGAGSAAASADPVVAAPVANDRQFMVVAALLGTGAMLLLGGAMAGTRRRRVELRD